MTYEILQDMMARAHTSRITIVGDFCLDKYLYIDETLDEPSLETGLTAYQVVGKGLFAGGAGTIANNLRGLTACVKCVGIVGEDGEGFELLRALDEIGADTSRMVKDKNRVTSTYTKPMYGKPGDYKELNRLDIKNFEPMKPDVEAKIIDNMRAAAKESDAIILLDQFIEENCGVVNAAVREAAHALAKEYPNLVIFADSRAFIHLFKGVIVKCNNFEVVRCVRPGYAGEPDAETVLACGTELHAQSNRPVYVTRGEHGVMVFDDSGAHSAAALKVPGPFDIVGAGDSASSAIVLALTLGATPLEAAQLANIVASIVIQQIGVTGFSTPELVLKRYKQYPPAE